MKVKELISTLSSHPEAEIVFSVQPDSDQVYKLATIIYDYDEELIYLIFGNRKLFPNEVND